jgi:hypothetical protein
MTRTASWLNDNNTIGLMICPTAFAVMEKYRNAIGSQLKVQFDVAYPGCQSGFDGRKRVPRILSSVTTMGNKSAGDVYLLFLPDQWISPCQIFGNEAHKSWVRPYRLK